MKVSIITATRNSETTISSTIESVNSQSYTDIEHIFVDGASADGTKRIISQLAKRSPHLVSKKDSGIYEALNRGIDLASGNVVGFLHSDDFFYSESVVEKIAKAFEDPSVDMCFGDLVYVGQSDTKKTIRRWKAGAFSHRKLKFGWMPPHPTLYVRRELIKEFPFDPKFKISGDYDQMLRLFGYKNIHAVYIPEQLVKMRWGGASNKSLSSVLIKTREDWKAIRSNTVGGLSTLVGKNLRKLPQFC